MVLHCENHLLEPLFLIVYAHTTAIIIMKERNDIVDHPADKNVYQSANQNGAGFKEVQHLKRQTKSLQFCPYNN